MKPQLVTDFRLGHTSLSVRHTPRWKGTNVYYQAIKSEYHTKVSRMTAEQMVAAKASMPSADEVRRRIMFGY